MITRSPTQTTESTAMAWASADAEAIEASAVKARIWPAERTIAGVCWQPAMKPTK
ncbi:MAG: hypothetical protein AAFV51_13335 [Pseudomonadota bacterium]